MKWYEKADEEFIKLPQDNPVVVCERSLCLFESSSYTKCLLVLREFGQACDGDPNDTPLWYGKWKDLPECLLLSLLQSTVLCFKLSTTCVSSAKQVLDRVHSWLKDIPTKQYANIHVTCLRHYFILVAHLARLSLFYPIHRYTDLPRYETAENIELPPSSQLRVWQEALQGEGRFQDAYYVALVTRIKFSLMGNGPEDIIPAFQSFIGACGPGGDQKKTSSLPTARQEPVWILETYARYTLLKLQSQLRKTSSLAEEVDVEGALARIKQIFEGVEPFVASNDLATFQELVDNDIQHVRLQLSNPIAELDSDASEAALVKVTQFKSLAEKFLHHNNFAAADNCLTCALGSYSNVADEEERKHTEDRLFERVFNLWRDSGDLLSYVHHFLGKLPSTISQLKFGGRKLYDSQLKELERATGCCLSESGSFVARRQYAELQWIYASQIQDDTTQRHFVEELKNILKADQELWIDESDKNIENIGELKEEVDTNVEPAIMSVAKAPGCEDEAWLLPLRTDLSKWLFINPDSRHSLIFWGVLRELLWKDFVTAQGLEETVARILNMDLPHDLEDLSRILDPDISIGYESKIRDQVILDHNTPTPLLCWEERFKIVKEWLMHPHSNSEVFKQPRGKREVLMMLIALERRNHYGIFELGMDEFCIKSAASQAEIFIQACEFLLTLHSEMTSTLAQRSFMHEIPLTHELLGRRQFVQSLNGEKLGLTKEERLKCSLSAERHVTTALEQFSALPEKIAAAFLPNTFFTMGQIIHMRLELSPQCDFWRVLWEGLSYFEKGEKFLDAERQDLASVHADLDGLMIQRSIVDRQNAEIPFTHLFYNSALALLSDVRDKWVHEQEHVEIVDTLIWYWVQKAKGRLLAEFWETRRLREYLVPGELNQGTQTTSTELAEPKPISDENDMLPGENTFQVALRNRAHQELAYWETFMENALNRFNSCDGDVIIVDWYAGPWQKMEEYNLPIVMTTFKLGQGNKPTTTFLDFSFDQANMWVETYCPDSTERSDSTEAPARPMLARPSANYDLRTLDPLIAPLAQLSNPGDVLILCPTSSLHRIPFHALSLEGHTLIRRNPVVYTHSSWMLRHSTTTCEQLDIQGDSAIIFGNPKAANPKKKPLQRGHDFCKTLARSLDVTANLEGQATKAAFTSAFQKNKSSLIHFQGHGKFDNSAPLNHGLMFAGDEILSAREVFELHSPDSTHHVTLMACESGMGDFGGADCAIGLVPAFLCSGATSTLSTLWPVMDVTAAFLADSFYKACKKSRQGGAVDLAKALQTAIGSLLDLPTLREHAEKQAGEKIEGEIPLYYWAGYVLHGFWLREGFKGLCE